MLGAGLSRRSPRKAPLGKPAFQPYWGKLAVRNDRGDRGNGGIIRSPIRASILPDRELLPRADLVGVLLNPNDPLTDAITSDVRQAASVVGQRIEVLHASNSREIDAAFASLVRKRASAVVLGPGPLFFTRRVQIVTLATRHAIPAIYGAREFAQAGGLMSYGADLADAWRQVGDYAGRVLKGTKPGDLPVMQSTKLELVINLQTARAFDLEIPPTLLARADEVIE